MSEDKEQEETPFDREEQLKGLMEGLQVPNVDLWMVQEPDTFKMLGALITMRAVGAPEEVIQRANKRLIASLTLEEDAPKIELLNDGVVTPCH